MHTIAYAQLERGRISGRDVREEGRRLRELGATWVHVHDVDGAAGGALQWVHANRLLDAGLQVSWGGGVRSLTQIQQLLDLGAARVASGTQANTHPLWFREAARIFGARLMLDVTREDDPRGKARALHDAGHGCTIVPAAAGVGIVREAGVPVWVALDGVRDEAAWSGASALLVDVGELERSRILERHPGPAPPRRRVIEAQARHDGTAEE
jgi:hypothetical protein